MEQIAVRLDLLTYLAVAALPISVAAVLLSGWTLVLKAREREDDRVFRRRVLDKLYPDTPPAPPPPKRPSPLPDYASDVGRGTVPSEEPPEPPHAAVRETLLPRRRR